MGRGVAPTAAVHNDVAGAPQVHVEVCSSTIDEDIACAAGGPEGQVLQVAEHGGEAVPASAPQSVCSVNMGQGRKLRIYRLI